MGSFGYICNGCRTPIRGNCITGGELCVLKHVRHGEVIGEVTGHYNEFGTVIEDIPSVFRNTDNVPGPNSHKEIGVSEFGLMDSIGVDFRMIDGQLVSWVNIRDRVFAENGIEFANHSHERFREVIELANEEWSGLPKHLVCNPKSGIEAWHLACYEKAPEEKKERHIISKSDPNQSWGSIRKKFV